MIMSAPFPTVASVLNRAIEHRVFPGAVVEVGRAGGALATIVRGAQTYASDASAVALDTVYDLASLTKVLATTALMVGEVDRGRVRLTDRVRHWIPSWTGDERQPVTIQDLLEHCSGLPAHRPYWEQRRGRASFELAICEEPLACQPRTQAIYSDPGFMLLGFAIQPRRGSKESLPPKTPLTAKNAAARCTTRIVRRLMALPVTRGYSGPPPRSAHARAGG